MKSLYTHFQKISFNGLRPFIGLKESLEKNGKINLLIPCTLIGWMNSNTDP